MVDKKEEQKSREYERAQSVYAKHFDQIKEAASELAKVSEHKDFQAHAQKLGMRMPSINIPSLIKGLSGEICKDWPILKQILDYAKQIGNIPFLSWFAPTIAAILAVIGPFIDLVDTQLIPLVCAVGGTSAPSTGGTTSAPSGGGGEIQHR